VQVPTLKAAVATVLVGVLACARKHDEVAVRPDPVAHVDAAPEASAKSPPALLRLRKAPPSKEEPYLGYKPGSFEILATASAPGTLAVEVIDDVGEGDEVVDGGIMTRATAPMTPGNEVLVRFWFVTYPAAAGIDPPGSTGQLQLSVGKEMVFRRLSTVMPTPLGMDAGRVFNPELEHSTYTWGIPLVVQGEWTRLVTWLFHGRPAHFTTSGSAMLPDGKHPKWSLLVKLE